MGSELAQAFRRLGSEVDLVHSRNNLLPKDEPEAGEVLRRQFEREGVSCISDLGRCGRRTAG